MLYNRLSWGLLYAALVTTMSILMSIIATYTALFPNSDFIVIFFLIFLYGISSVSRTVMVGKNILLFMLSSVQPLRLFGKIWDISVISFLKVIIIFIFFKNNDLYSLLILYKVDRMPIKEQNLGLKTGKSKKYMRVRIKNL